MRPFKNAERDNFIRFQISIQPETFATTTTLAKSTLFFFAQETKREAREVSKPKCFSFFAQVSPRLFANTNVKFQSASFDTRSETTSNSDNSKINKYLSKRILLISEQETPNDRNHLSRFLRDQVH